MTTQSSKFDCHCFFWGIFGIQGHVVGQQYLKYVWVDNNMSGPWPCPKSHRISLRYHVCIHSLMHNIKLHLKQHDCKYFVSFVVGVTFNFYFILYIYLLAHFCKLQKTTPICSITRCISIWILSCQNLSAQIFIILYEQLHRMHIKEHEMTHSEKKSILYIYI